MASNEQIAHAHPDALSKAKSQSESSVSVSRLAPRAASAGSTQPSASHALTSPTADADAAFPVFRNQVAGHSPLLWHKGTICKPLNPTEYFFYSQLIAGELSALTPFAPKFYGILDMSYIPVEFQKQQVEKDQRKAEKRKVLQEREAKLAQQQAAAAAKAAAASVTVQTITSVAVQNTRTEFSIDTAAVASAAISGSFTSSTSLASGSIPGLSTSQSIPVSLGSATGSRGDGDTALSAAMVASASATPPASSPQHQHQMNTWVLTCQKRQKASARSADVTSQAQQQLEEQMHAQSHAKYATLPASFELSPEAQRKDLPDEHLATESSSHEVSSPDDPQGTANSLTTPTQLVSTSTSVDPLHPAQASSNEPLPQYIVLEDLTFAYDRPCILDLKLGTRQHGINDSPKKIASKIEKCLKTTSGKLGLRLCLTQDHSVLVRNRGWVRIDQVKKKDEVWSMEGLGKETGGWSQVTDEVVQPLGENEELVHFSSERIELMCTRQHAMWTADPKTNKWTNEHADQVAGHRLVRLASKVSEKAVSSSWSVSDDCKAWYRTMRFQSTWAEIIGCVLASGQIIQNENVAKEKETYVVIPLLPSLKLTGITHLSQCWRTSKGLITVAESDVVRFFESLMRPVVADRLQWLFDLTQKQASEVLEAYFRADQAHFCRDVPVVDAHQREILLTLAAIACQSITSYATLGQESWEVLLNAPDSLLTPLASMAEHRQLIPFEQHCQKTVYCITVQRGNFLVRRDGTPRSTPLFVGNCGMQVYHPTRKLAVTPMTSIAELSDGSAPPEPADGKFVYYDKYYGRSLNEDTFLKTLKLFFWNGEKLLLHIILLFLERLDKLRKTLELRQMNKYRFYSSSLLMVYEGQTSKPSTGSATPAEGGWSSTRHESTEDAPEAPLSANNATAGPNPRPDHYPALSSLNSSHRLHEIVDRSLNISGGSSSNGGMPRSHSIDFHQVTQQSVPPSLEAAAAATAVGTLSTPPSEITPARRALPGDSRSILSPTAAAGSPVQLHAAPHLTPTTSSGGTPGKSPTPTPTAAHLDADDLLELHQILAREVARIESIRRGYGGIVEQKQEEEKIEEAKRQRLLAAAEERARDLANGVVTAHSTVLAKVVHHAADSHVGLMTSQGVPGPSSRTSLLSTHLATPSDTSTPSVGVFSPSSHVSYVHVAAGLGDGQHFHGHHESQPSAEPANSLHASPQPPSPLPVPHVLSPSTGERTLSGKETKLGGPYASSPAILPSAPALGAPSASAAPKFYNRVRKTTHAQARERARLKGNIDIRLIDYAQVVKWDHGEERAIVDVDHARSPTAGDAVASDGPPPIAEVPAVEHGVGDPGLLIGVNNLIYFISNIVTQEIHSMLVQEQARVDALGYSIGRSVSMAPLLHAQPAMVAASVAYDPAASLLRTRTPPLSESLEGGSGVHARAPERRPDVDVVDAPGLLIDSSSHTAAFSSSHVPKSKAIIIPPPATGTGPNAQPAVAMPVPQRGSPNKPASSTGTGTGTPPGTVSSKRTTM